MFDFDNFVNKTAHGIFGRQIAYRPKNTDKQPFTLSGDFHVSYMDISLVNAGADISSAKTVVFVRLAEFPIEYSAPLAGDYMSIDGKNYQIIDIQEHIPGSQKLILHKDE